AEEVWRALPPPDRRCHRRALGPPPAVGRGLGRVDSFMGRRGRLVGPGQSLALRPPTLPRWALCPAPWSQVHPRPDLRDFISRTIRGALRDDRALLDDEIWEIFETEPIPGMLELFPIHPWVAGESRWEVTLAGLADEGRLSRTRLLDASLGGLERDYHEARTK